MLPKPVCSGARMRTPRRIICVRAHATSSSVRTRRRIRCFRCVLLASSRSLSLSLLPIFKHVEPATFIFARRAPHAAENSQDGLLIVRCHLHQGYRSLTCKLCDTSKCNERSRRRDRRSMCEETIYFHGLLHIALHGTVRLPLRYPQQFGDVLQRCLGKCSRLNYTSA
jgi:hypothetical protein